MVALSIDREGLPKVEAFYQQLGLKSLDIYVDQTGKAAGRLGGVGIPTTLLIDGNGWTVGPAEWDSEEVLQVLQPYVKSPAAGDDAPGVGTDARDSREREATDVRCP